LRKLVAAGCFTKGKEWQDAVPRKNAKGILKRIFKE